MLMLPSGLLDAWLAVQLLALGAGQALSDLVAFTSGILGGPEASDVPVHPL